MAVVVVVTVTPLAVGTTLVVILLALCWCCFLFRVAVLPLVSNSVVEDKFSFKLRVLSSSFD